MIDNTTFGTRTAMYVTLGCKLNFAETSTVARILADRGIRRAQAGETPDLCVVNTCSVTELADKKGRQAIRSLAKRFPGATIIATGCYAQLKPDEVASIEGVDIVAGVNSKLRIGEFLDQWEKTHQPQTIVTPARDLREFMPSCSKGDRTRYFLKVQDGCDYWCSYCTIPAARGRSRSGRIADLTAQARQVASEGGREIVITGVNIGEFGRDTGESFLDLLRALDSVDGIERFRISSIEPNLLTDEVIDFTAGARRFMPHFHIPLQSGSDEVLRLMRRRYDTALFRSKVERIRSVMPDTFIGVDLIVGARGETADEFARSKEFVESLDISRLHVFTYSERPGTRALDIAHKVEQAEKHRRTRVMLAVSEQKLRLFSSRFEGSVRPVLLEHPHRGRMTGLTDNYLRVEIEPHVPEAANTVLPVRLVTLSPDAGQFSGSIDKTVQP